ncbi:MAG: pantoate--beta-alanine ligase [Treponema sp.]|jgi:pantoate--beta-alanine ligase|nr:pantoate--beta-alanine ligase [Treponema sp.]
MNTIHTLPEWRKVEKKLLCTGSGTSIGLVPTMGALHQGHVSLIKRSIRENDKTIVSIFLNPVQFTDSHDYDAYPRQTEADCRLLADTGVDYVFLPEYRDLYPDDYRYQLTEHDFSSLLCGASRPGHFDGVLTVVMKLLQIFRPDRAYFGEKDFQQYRLIDGMAKAFFLSTEIVPCPVVREPSGLAFSSRNSRLSAEGRTKAALFYRALSSGEEPEMIRKRLEKEGFRIDYITEMEGRLYGAVFLEEVRLIDNVKRS